MPNDYFEVIIDALSNVSDGEGGAEPTPLLKALQMANEARQGSDWDQVAKARELVDGWKLYGKNDIIHSLKSANQNPYRAGVLLAKMASNAVSEFTQLRLRQKDLSMTGASGEDITTEYAIDTEKELQLSRLRENLGRWLVFKHGDLLGRYLPLLMPLVEVDGIIPEDVIRRYRPTLDETGKIVDYKLHISYEYLNESVPPDVSGVAPNIVETWRDVFLRRITADVLHPLYKEVEVKDLGDAPTYWTDIYTPLNVGDPNITFEEFERKYHETNTLLFECIETLDAYIAYAQNAYNQIFTNGASENQESLVKWSQSRGEIADDSILAFRALVHTLAIIEQQNDVMIRNQWQDQIVTK